MTAAEDIVEEILDSTDAMDTGGQDADVLSFGSGEDPPSHGEGSEGEEEEEEEEEGMESEDEDSEGDLLSDDRYNSAGEEVS